MNEQHPGRAIESLVVVAVGTLRRPKVRAVERALRLLNERHREFLAHLRVEPRNVPSGVSSTPTTTEECMKGARLRAEAARAVLTAQQNAPVLGIGLEGGIVSLGGNDFLESWAHVTDGERHAFGSSGRIPLPRALARTVLAEGRDLGPAADDFFDRRDVASHEGTFGVLSRDAVTREEAFVRSLLHALAPFYNADVYRKGE